MLQDTYIHYTPYCTQNFKADRYSTPKEHLKFASYWSCPVAESLFPSSKLLFYFDPLPPLTILPRSVHRMDGCKDEWCITGMHKHPVFLFILSPGKMKIRVPLKLFFFPFFFVCSFWGKDYLPDKFEVLVERLASRGFSLDFCFIDVNQYFSISVFQQQLNYFVWYFLKLFSQRKTPVTENFT